MKLQVQVENLEQTISSQSKISSINVHKYDLIYEFVDIFWRHL